MVFKVVVWVISGFLGGSGASLMAKMAKNLLAMLESQVQSRPGFDPWAGKMPWSRKWQLTPIFLPGEFHGQRSLVGYSPWGRNESDATERLIHSHRANPLTLAGLLATSSLPTTHPSHHVHGSGIPVKTPLLPSFFT